MLPPAPLGRDEVVGQVIEVNTVGSPPLYQVMYSLPKDPNVEMTALGRSSSVTDGQAVVVRDDATHPQTASVVATSPPQSRITPLGWVVVPVALALALWSWVSSGYRLRRRRLQRDEETDCRKDVWASTTNSA